MFGAAVFLVLGVAVTSVSAALPPRPIGGWRQAEVVPGRPSTANCTWKNFSQKIDHFGDAPGTFPQRLCIYDKWWKSATRAGFSAAADAPGPILFYTGNESPVEEYINNTGLMWEIAEQMGALIVFAEHRFEPLSHPALCGFGTQKCFAFCTTAQAIADWATIIADLRTQHTVRAPAVAFGGSYGGMIAGWFRIKYPEVIDGVIAASAPIWQLAGTVQRETLDMQAVAITRGVSAAGGATDQCRDNLIAAWPLLHELGKSENGLKLVSEPVKACSGTLKSVDSLINWAQGPYFFLAEGNYPFPSDYITFSLRPGNPPPLPAWPMRVACEQGLNRDFGVQLSGSVRDVRYGVSLGALHADVNWRDVSGNGATLTSDEIRSSGILDLAKAVADAAGVWYNLTKDVTCNNFGGAVDVSKVGLGRGLGRSGARHGARSSRLSVGRMSAEMSAASSLDVATTLAAAELKPELKPELKADPPPVPGGKLCPTCPPCEGCPACPVQYCNVTQTAECSHSGELDKAFSWDGICCNDALSQIDIHGVGRDIFWPPQPAFRNYTVESVVGPKGLHPGWCASEYGRDGLYGAPLIEDLWSTWMESYYGGRDHITEHTNIVWSNGALDPWSGQGVYPPGGGPEVGKPVVQNISADGSQFALILDLGAHHLDLMFTDPRNPPCFFEARAIEERVIRKWCQQAYDAHAPA